MTFQLRRKRPITAPSTRRTADTILRSAVVATVICAQMIPTRASADDALADDAPSGQWVARKAATASSPSGGRQSPDKGATTAGLQEPGRLPAIEAKDIRTSNGKLRWQARRPSAESTATARKNGSKTEATAPLLTSPKSGTALSTAAEDELVPTPMNENNAAGSATSTRGAVAQAAALEPVPQSSESAISNRQTRARTRNKILTVAADDGADPFRDPFADQGVRSEPARYQPPRPTPAAPNRGRAPSNSIYDDPSLDNSIPPDGNSQPQDDPNMSLPPGDSMSPLESPPADNQSPFENRAPLDNRTPMDNSPLDSDPYATPNSPSDLTPPPSAPTPAATEPSPCDPEKKNCAEAVDKIRSNTIDKIALDIRISGSEGLAFPCECTLGGGVFKGRAWSPTYYTFKAAATCHKPLYFEDVQLERYGHAWNPALQGFLSGAHFFANVALLPYHMGVNPPNECIYTLGYYRPGNCAPYVIEPFPLSVRGAVLEAGAIATGLWILNLY